jgi:hypothetical protein
MLRSSILTGMLGLVGLAAASTAAGAHCTCGYSRAPAARHTLVRVHTFVTPVPNRRVHPRWQYAAAYYNRPRAAGYTLMSGSADYPAYRTHGTRAWRW